MMSCRHKTDKRRIPDEKIYRSTVHRAAFDRRCAGAVSYTHLDVYKRQHHGICNPAAGWFVYKADRHPAAVGTE